MTIKSIIEDDYYRVIAPDGTEISRGSKKDKRYTDIIAHGVPGEYRIIQPEVKVLLAASAPIEIDPPNLPPSWTGTPTPQFTDGQAGTYDLSEFAFDPEGDTLTYSVVTGSLPTGVTLNASTGVLTATTSVVEGTTSGLVFGLDDGNNSVVNSPSVDLVVQAAPSGSGAKNWTPGHYLKTQGDFAKTDQTGYWSDVNAKIDDRVEDSANILGAMVVVAWGTFNTHAANSTYDWTNLDACIANLDSKGKKVIIKVQHKSARGYQELVMPADLEAAGYLKTNNAGCIAAIWETSVMSYYIEALSDMAARYNNDSTVEAITTSEAVPSWAGNPDPTFSWSAYNTELLRQYQECAASFDNIAFYPGINFGQSYVPGWMEQCYQSRIGSADPDIGASDVDGGGDYIYKGLGGATRDYRGLIPRMNIASQPVLGGKDDLSPPSNVINYAQTLGTSHLCWVSDQSSPNSWSDILTAIAADPNLATTYPSRWPTS